MSETNKAVRPSISVVTPSKEHEKEQQESKRVSTGIRDLDAIIEGGFPIGKSYLIVGETGSGKTIFCMQFALSGLTAGEKVVYVPFDEKPSEVVDNATSLGWDLGQYVKGGHLVMLDTALASSAMSSSQRDVDISKVVSDLASYVQRAGASRLIIDPVGPLLSSTVSAKAASERARILIRGLQDNLGITSLLTLNSSAEGNASAEWEGYPVSGVIQLGFRQERKSMVRTLLVTKMRATAIDLTERRFHIAKGRGIVIDPVVHEPLEPAPAATAAPATPQAAPPQPQPDQVLQSFFKEWPPR